MVTHSSVFAWEIPWTEEPGRLQSIWSQELDTTEQLKTITVIIIASDSSRSSNRLDMIAPISWNNIQMSSLFSLLFLRLEFYLYWNTYSLRQYFSNVLSGGTDNINVPKDVLLLKLNNDSLSHSSERKEKKKQLMTEFSQNLPSVRFFLNSGFQFYLTVIWVRWDLSA